MEEESFDCQQIVLVLIVVLQRRTELQDVVRFEDNSVDPQDLR